MIIMFHRSNSMVSRSAGTRALLFASIAALVVTSFDAHAAPAAAQSAGATGQQLASGDGAELGARKRMRVRRGNNAAGLAMMGMMIGAVGGVIASQQRREAYEARRAYPVYGGGYAYGPQPYVSHQSQVYHQPQVYHQQRVYPQQPYAYRGGPRAYDDPVIQRLNQQTPGVINYGPPRIGW